MSHGTLVTQRRFGTALAESLRGGLRGMTGEQGRLRSVRVRHLEPDEFGALLEALAGRVRPLDAGSYDPYVALLIPTHVVDALRAGPDGGDQIATALRRTASRLRASRGADLADVETVRAVLAAVEHSGRHGRRRR